MKSFIRWAGSKRQLLKKLRPYWPDNANRYVEPFAGSACLFFDLQPPRALLGDLNSELIATYQALKENSADVLARFNLLPRGKESYYIIRSQDPSSLTEIDLAARFLYLNRYCFNGLYRTNANGQFNVPYGPPKRELLNFEQDVLTAARSLQKATLRAADFEDVLGEVRAGDFVYLDPPFMVQKRRVFREYLSKPFDNNDLDRLGSCLRRIDEIGATYLLSYADCREARVLTETLAFKRVRVRRHIAGFVDSRRSSWEILATNKNLGDCT